MAITMKMNAMNQVPVGEKLFEEGMDSDGIFVVLKGKGELVNSSVCLPVVSGDFLGIWDMQTGRYNTGCIATEEMTVFAFPATTDEELLSFLDGNKEYSGRVTATLGRLIAELHTKLGCYLQEAKMLPNVIEELYRQYCARCKAEELRAAELPKAGKEVFSVPDSPEWLEYYLEAAKIPAEAQKNYFTCDAKVAYRHIEEQVTILRWLFAECEKQGAFLRRLGSVLMNGGADNLFFYFCALEEKAGTAETKKAAVLLRDVTEKKLTELAALFEKCAGEPFETHQKKRDARKQGAGHLAEGEEPCENALEQILSFAGVSEETGAEFTKLLKTFAGLEDKAAYHENDLESAVIEKMQKFLLELGKGFLFEQRQKRFSFNDKNFYVDLVLYNRLLKCYVLIDFKIDELTHQDLGQMQMYVNYFDRYERVEGENPTIGILLCKQSDEALVDLTLPKDANIYAKEYKLYLPDKKLLQKKLKEWLDEEDV